MESEESVCLPPNERFLSPTIPSTPGPECSVSDQSFYFPDASPTPSDYESVSLPSNERFLSPVPSCPTIPSTPGPECILSPTAGFCNTAPVSQSFCFPDASHTPSDDDADKGSTSSTPLPPSTPSSPRPPSVSSIVSSPATPRHLTDISLGRRALATALSTLSPASQNPLEASPISPPPSSPNSVVSSSSHTTPVIQPTRRRYRRGKCNIDRRQHESILHRFQAKKGAATKTTAAVLQTAEELGLSRSTVFRKLKSPARSPKKRERVEKVSSVMYFHFLLLSLTFIILHYFYAT